MRSWFLPLALPRPSLRRALTCTKHESPRAWTSSILLPTCCSCIFICSGNFAPVLNFVVFFRSVSFFTIKVTVAVNGGWKEWRCLVTFVKEQMNSWRILLIVEVQVAFCVSKCQLGGSQNVYILLVFACAIFRSIWLDDIRWTLNLNSCAE